jgi:hypothetical protein
MSAWIMIGGVVVLGVAVAAAWFLRRGGRRTGVVRPYGEIRQQIIDEVGDGEATAEAGPPPERPVGLDARLPMSVYEELAALYSRRQEPGFNWNRFSQLWNKVVWSVGEEVYGFDSSGIAWFELVSPARRAVLLAESLEAEVNNGGFDQFYLNSSGDGARWTPEAMRLLGQDDLAALVERCNAVFPARFAGPPRERGRRLAAMDEIGESDREVWSQADDAFYALEFPDRGLGLGVAFPFVMANRDEFFRAS